MANKRQIRIQALDALYEMEFQTNSPKKNWGTKDCAYLINGVIAHKEKINQLINQHSQHWKMSRINLLDLTILRIAVYEIMFFDTKESSKIFINEAIELAKIYGSGDSPRFINGILDSISKAG